MSDTKNLTMPLPPPPNAPADVPNPFGSPLPPPPNGISPLASPPPPVQGMDNKNRLVIFDFSNLAYMSMFAVTRQPEILEEGFDGHYQVFISKINNLLSIISDMSCELIFCLDSFPKAKKKVFPEYKNGRKKFDFDPKKGLLTALSNIVEFKIAKMAGYEADDLMASLVAKNPDKSCVVVTSDKDLWSLMEYENCSIYDLHKREYVTHERFVDKFRVKEYKHLTLAKTLWGDPSDNVPNCMKATQKVMVPLIGDTDGTLASFFEKFDEKRDQWTKSVIKKFDENQEQMIDNYTIVSLNTSLDVETHPYERGLEYKIGKE